MKLLAAIDGLRPFEVELIDKDSQTIRRLTDALPIESTVNRWGDEIYFFVDFEAPLETDARKEMKVGEVAYWPRGPALAIFFGRTPASRGDAPMAASECNIVGKVNASPDELRKAKDGAKIILRKL
ncbi:MAG: cyclophilin-like fold protein [Thermoplasmata archaeon]